MHPARVSHNKEHMRLCFLNTGFHNWHWIILDLFAYTWIIHETHLKMSQICWKNPGLFTMPDLFLYLVLFFLYFMFVLNLFFFLPLILCGATHIPVNFIMETIWISFYYGHIKLEVAVNYTVWFVVVHAAWLRVGCCFSCCHLNSSAATKNASGMFAH